MLVLIKCSNFNLLINYNYDLLIDEGRCYRLTSERRGSGRKSEEDQR